MIAIGMGDAWCDAFVTRFDQDVNTPRNKETVMQYRGPLMIEHRLIERMIDIVRDSHQQGESEQRIDPHFVDAVVDFIRTYADKTHHGKEEDVLFRNLKQKELKSGDAETMEELIQEHVFGRQVTRELVEANEAYKSGDQSSLQTVLEKFRTLTDFYPEHIDKEDRVFFPAALGYLSDEEQQAMLREFEEVDRRMIHEKYTALIASYEKS